MGGITEGSLKGYSKEQIKAALRHAASISPYAFIKTSKVLNEKSLPMLFDRHKFLIDIYDDWSPLQTCRKSSQAGFSTMNIIKALFAAKHKGYNIIYTLPSFNDVKEFVPSKVNTILENNPDIAAWVKNKDSVTSKQVGDRFIYFRGTFSNKTEAEKMESSVGIMLTADLHIADESDRSDQVILEQYESRLDASDYRGRWFFSNATHPNTLTQQMWEISDQKHWFIKCNHCNEWQFLDFPDSIAEVNGRYEFVCSACGRILSEQARCDGQWVKKYNTPSVSGYWINQLMYPWKSAEDIMKLHGNKTKQYFENFVMGRPYIGSDVIVSRDLILSNLDPDGPNMLEGNVMGVDVGNVKHVVIKNKQGTFKILTVEDWDDVRKLMRIYNIKRCVIDGMPDITEPKKLIKEFPGRVWVSFFQKDVKSTDFIRWNDSDHTVHTDRSKMIEQIVDKHVERKHLYQMEAEDLEVYIKHFSTLYRFVTRNSLGIEQYVWDTTSSEDHYVFADIYAELALGASYSVKLKKQNHDNTPKAHSPQAPDIQKIIKKSLKRRTKSL